MMKNNIQIHPKDNVVVALQELHRGENIQYEDDTIRITETIPFGHKIALRPIEKGEGVIKYGFPIGHAIEAIPKGGWVNEKKVKTNLTGIHGYSWYPTQGSSSFVSMIDDKPLTFKGYVRASGEVGIRNELWIIPTVGCVNDTATQLVACLKEEMQKASRKMDAIVALRHPYGCSQLGDDHANTREILSDLALHPNAGAVLILGLGCENNQSSAMRQLIEEKVQHPIDPQRIQFLNAQEVTDEMAVGMDKLRTLYQFASQDRRTEVPLSTLRIGLKCGGSDGLSGITANPLLGYYADYLVAKGGTTVLTEVPEMFGAEQLLMNRCPTEALFNKTVHLINAFKAYFIANKQPIYENPSPGNKAGGISTLEDKSLGCVQKAGTSQVCDVLAYGERIKTTGLNLLSAPGNDLVASTALVAAGCQLILFTTGRGTPFGTCVPTVKVATNTALAQRKANWIDFDAGKLLVEPKEDVLTFFIRQLNAIINGKAYTKNEKTQSHSIAILKTGVTL